MTRKKKTFSVRLFEDRIEGIKATAKKYGMNTTDFIDSLGNDPQRLFRAFTGETETPKRPTLYPIINAFESCFCYDCGDKIPIGQKCLWGKDEDGRTLYICSGCEIETEGDKTIVKRLIKKRALDREIRALKNRLDVLAHQYEENRYLEHLIAVRELATQEHKFFMDFQRGLARWGAKKESEKIEGILQMLRKIIRYTNDFNAYYEAKLKSNAQRGRVHA